MSRLNRWAKQLQLIRVCRTDLRCEKAKKNNDKMKKKRERTMMDCQLNAVPCRFHACKIMFVPVIEFGEILTSIGSDVSLTRRPPSPLCVISTSIDPSRSIDTLLLPFETPSGFFFRLLGCESAGRRRTWNMMDPFVWMKFRNKATQSLLTWFYPIFVRLILLWHNECIVQWTV